MGLYDEIDEAIGPDTHVGLGKGGRKLWRNDEEETYDFRKHVGNIKVDRKPVTLRYSSVKDDGWTTERLSEGLLGIYPRVSEDQGWRGDCLEG